MFLFLPYNKHLFNRAKSVCMGESWPQLHVQTSLRWVCTYDLSQDSPIQTSRCGYNAMQKFVRVLDNPRALYKQIDGMAMGSPLCPLLANLFMSSIKENLEREGKLPFFYRRYVDDMLTIMLNIATASNWLDTLNKAYSSIKFKGSYWTDCLK